MARYTETDKKAAIIAYIEKGSYKGAARVCGVPESTLRGWHQQSPSWWQQVEDEQRELFEQEQRAYLSEIRTKSAKAVLDRLENGDERIVQGEKVRVKISGKDAATIYGIATDKIRVSLGQPTSITERQSAQDKLKELKQHARDTTLERAKESGKVTELRK